MLLLSQAPNGALSARRHPHTPTHPTPPLSTTPLFSHPRSRRLHSSPLPPLLSLSRPHAVPKSSPENDSDNNTIIVGDAGVPLEGVIKADRAGGLTDRILNWAQVGLLAGGDVLCLILFCAVGRFSHGFPVLDFETVRTADPFISGWLLSAYFLGGYGDDGKGKNGSTKAILAAAKSWATGIPLGLVIRTIASGHTPATPFILVSMGSTGILLIGWRALVSSLLRSRQSPKNDAYKRGSPFELFELLTSLVRRW